MNITELIKMAKARKLTPEDIVATATRMKEANNKYEAKELYQAQHSQDMLNKVYSI